MLTGAETSEVRAPKARRGRVRSVTSLDRRTIVSLDGPDGPVDVVVPLAPDGQAAVAAAAGLWRLQWVRLQLDGVSPHARLAGTTRHPHVRVITLAAGLALAAQGLPAFVVGQED